MKMIKYLCLVAFALFIIGVARPAHAQYGFDPHYKAVSTPASVPSGGGVSASSSSCGCFITSAGFLIVDFTGGLVWNGPGSPTSGAIVYENTHVDGSASVGSGASSSAIITAPLAVQVNGTSGNIGSYAPQDQPAVTGYIFPQAMSGRVRCDVSGSGSAYAQINYHL